MIGSDSATHKILIKIPAAAVIKMAISRVWLAPFLSFSPRLLATIAETDTFMAMNKAIPKNLGWVVSPTAATAWWPRALTIRESISPARATKKDSSTEGHAIRTATFILSWLSCKYVATPVILRHLTFL